MNIELKQFEEKDNIETSEIGFLYYSFQVIT